MHRTLRNLREQNNYSQSAVASFLGISRQTYIKYESGEAVPPVKIVTELAGFYRVPYDVLLEDKLGTPAEEDAEGARKPVTYDIAETEPLEVHDSAAAYAMLNDSRNVQNPSYYLKSILEMLPKLLYTEQLAVLEKISGMVQKATAEKMLPNKRMQSYQTLMNFADSLHLKSDGTKWTREELYER